MEDFDFIQTNEHDDKAHAGEPLDSSVTVASEEAIIEALRTVHDPEIPVNIYDLGLIYNFDINTKGNVCIDMTLTSPACPVAGTLPGMVAQAVAGTPGVGEVDVTLVWDPPWGTDKMSEDAKMILGID